MSHRIFVSQVSALIGAQILLSVGANLPMAVKALCSTRVQITVFSSTQLGLSSISDRDTRAAKRFVHSDRECTALNSATAVDRYEFSLSAICQQQELWMLFGAEELVTFASNPERVLVFPHRGLAQFWISASPSPALEPVPIPINDFIDVIVPQLIENGLEIEVFPSRSMDDSMPVAIDDFVFDLLGTWERVHETELIVPDEVKAEFLAWGLRVFAGRQRTQIRKTPGPKAL